jgi:DNA mismatch repair protein MutS2
MQALQTLEFDRVLSLVAMEAKSTPGKAAVLRRTPLRTLEQCETAQAELGEMVRFVHTEGLLPLAGLTDIAPTLQRETVLDLEEAWIVVRAARAAQSIREALLRSEAFPLLTELLTKTGRYFTREGKLREDASAELRAIRGRIHAKRSAIQRTLSDVMNRNASAIQEPLIVMRGERYCIPVRADHRNAVPGILHERSGSGASFFIEPMAAIELNNDLAQHLIEEREEIARILQFISQAIFDQHDELLEAIRISGELDGLQACAQFHDVVRGTRPTFSATRELRILDGRHPLLDERLAAAREEAFDEKPEGRSVIPLTIELRPSFDESPHSALVISGPNAGGKTVALKTAGLLVAMGMSGLPVPAAEGTVLPCVDALHVLVGDDQSVLEHLSTFSAYLVRLKRVLERATSQSLVLLDELGSGTDPEEGAAIAASVIEHLLDSGALLIVTTHLSALKSFAVNDRRILNASMEFDSATGNPTYRLLTGMPGRSRAIEVATTIGLPPAIIAAARERLGERYEDTDHLLSTLQKKMAAITEDQQRLDSAARALQSERRAMEEAKAKLERERLQLGSSYREELERLRDDVTRQISNEIRNLREMDRTARASLNAAEVVRTMTRSVEKALEFIPAEQREVRVGEKAEHRSFKVTGEIVSIDGSKAVISVNGRKMTVDVRDLVPKGAAAPPSRSPSRHPTVSSSDVAPISAELNLIGQRVDDALEECDRFLDRALLEGKQAVRLIHGFGTGTLRKAVRDYLRKHPAVKSWRPGAENEGGDGATVAVLDD